MYQIQSRMVENNCVIALIGHIDSANALQAEAEILALR